MSIERFFASPVVMRVCVHVAVFLAVVTVLMLSFAAVRPDVSRHSVLVDVGDCALVMTRDGGQTCR
jgi:hypothetical protein